MPTYHSPEQVYVRYEAAMGAPLAAAYQSIFDDVVWLRFKWQQFRELFGTSPERIELLQEAAGTFFGVLQAVLWEDTLLHLCRLTDPAVMGKRQNLTLRSLAPLVLAPALQGEVQTLVNEAVARTAFARDWRNRHIAHRDLPLALDAGADALHHASRQCVEDALRAIEAPLTAISVHYLESEVDFGLHGEPGDALDLLHVLSDGLNATRARERRFNSGKLLPEDLESPTAV